MSIDHVPELGARADPAALQLPAQHEPAADPGAEREHDHVAGAAAGAVPRLGEHRAVAVVVDRHREPEPLGHHRRERDVRERQVGRVRRPCPCAGRASRGCRSRPPRSPRRPPPAPPRRPRRSSPSARAWSSPNAWRRIAVAHGEIGADDAREELGAAEVDPDDAARTRAGRRHGGCHHTHRRWPTRNPTTRSTAAARGCCAARARRATAWPSCARPTRRPDRPDYEVQRRPPRPRLPTLPRRSRARRRARAGSAPGASSSGSRSALVALGRALRRPVHGLRADPARRPRRRGRRRSSTPARTR